MATTRHPDARNPLIAAAAALGLILAIVLSPDAVGVAASNSFASLRSPGEMGYVAGHRGDVDAGPENTLPALQAVIDGGAKFVETDVQLTSDGVPILMHDWTLDRTTDGEGPVWAATVAQIRALDAGSWYGAEYSGTKVPLFEEFLDILAPSDTHAIVELKGSWRPDEVALVERLISQYGLSQRIVFASFDIMTLKAAQLVAPGIQRAIISREVNGEPSDLADECGAVAIIVSKAFVLERPELVDSIHAAGLGVMLYTVNDSDTWTEVIGLGVDGIITDHPAELDRWATGP